MSSRISEIVRFEEFELNRFKRRLSRNGIEVPLPPKAFEVLSCLFQHSGQQVRKEELLEAVWSGRLSRGKPRSTDLDLA